MASVLENVAWESCLLEPRNDPALAAYAKQRQGIANPAISYFSPVPWLARALVDLHPEYGLLLHLDQDRADLVTLAVSQENSCRYCYAAVRALLWAQGMSRARIEQLERDLLRLELEPRVRAALHFGRAQSRVGPPAARAAREALLASGFSMEELKEIAFAVGVTDFSNRAHTIPAIPSQPIERLPDRFLIRLLRPLAQRILRRHRVRGEPAPPPTVEPQPYARLLKAYAGSPIAAALARVLDEMWASPVLGRRCKLAMLAVIARGLSCGGCARELEAPLRAAGLSEQSHKQLVAHLDAPELDAVERLLVAFAAETIWYEPAAVQRRAQVLRGRLSPEQLIEGIGVAALGNGLCRMAAMVVDCE